MNQDKIFSILEQLKTHQISASEAFSLLKNLPYKDIGIAKIDTHREIRRGLPEAILGQGKTKEQILKIAKEMIKTISPVLITKTSEKTYNLMKSEFNPIVYYPEAHIIKIGDSKQKNNKGTVSIVCAGTSDIPIAEESAVTLESFGFSIKRFFDVGVAGLQRLLDTYEDIANSDIVIVIAGMEGALPSVLSGLIDKPIIAVPTSIGYGSNFEGLSALLGMLNSCSPGITVVNIDNGFGAAYSSALILSNLK